MECMYINTPIKMLENYLKSQNCIHSFFHPSIHLSSQPSIHFQYVLISKLRVVGVCCSLSPLLTKL